jgi:hypothetical protein
LKRILEAIEQYQNLVLKADPDALLSLEAETSITSDWEVKNKRLKKRYCV